MTLTERHPSTKAFGDERDDYGDPCLYLWGGGGMGQEIQCRRFFAIDVVPVQFTIYSLSRLIRKMSDIYLLSHFV